MDLDERQKELLEDLDSAIEDFLDSGFGQYGTFTDYCKKPSFEKLQDAVMPLVDKHGLDKIAAADLDMEYGTEIIRNLQMLHSDLIKKPVQDPRGSWIRQIIRILILIGISIGIAFIIDKFST